ncbi:MAG: SDR family NAD(P)-dependent oxidoreductase [Loktanella sp.]|nr:SDR family NAD(P)-dependent oxidoreductase [Loktanella sp.]
MNTSPKLQELVVVTGASTGVGAATARNLAGKGFHVLAGVRREQECGKHMRLCTNRLQFHQRRHIHSFILSNCDNYGLCPNQQGPFPNVPE